jgi:hypothetical protein
MIAAGKSYLQSKLEEPNSSNTPQIMNEVTNTLFPATEIKPEQGSASQKHRPATPPTTTDVKLLPPQDTGLLAPQALAPPFQDPHQAPTL